MPHLRLSLSNMHDHFYYGIVYSTTPIGHWGQVISSRSSVLPFSSDHVGMPLGLLLSFFVSSTDKFLLFPSHLCISFLSLSVIIQFPPFLFLD